MFFAAFSDTCWRRYKTPELTTLEDAIQAADTAAKSAMWLGIDFVVSTHREGNELYRAKAIITHLFP
ncbi:MAG: hypothetical protein ACXW2E_00690 [Nitrososphaeraceae archaeon]